MIIKNKIYNSFGPAESFAGKLVFIFGVMTSFFSAYSSFLVMGGAFFGFTYLCTTIDTENYRIRSGDALFGFIKTGNWIDLNPNMTIGIIKSDKVWKSYSWSNRINKTEEKNYLITLFNANGKKLFPIKSLSSLKQAKEELEQFCTVLNLRPFQS
jgi:hypothetical protein